jgi:hypothetical protein
MKIKIVIVDFEMSPAAKKRLIRYGIPLAVVLGGGALAWAGNDWGLPHSWSNPGATNYAGPNLAAQALDDNFNALADAGASLEARVAALEAAHAKETADGGYSVNATYCGASSATTGAFTDGIATGYAAGKKMCEATCSSPSAHMCSLEEMTRSSALGLAPPAAAGTLWVSWGGFTEEPPSGATELGVLSDCGTCDVVGTEGWTQTACNDGTPTGFFGTAWTESGAGQAPCTDTNPVACCD